jgi:hypothetical protein
MAGRKWHWWLPAVKKAAASGGLGSSEQGSVWLAVEAPVDDGSGTRLGCTSAMACRCSTVAEQRWSSAGAWVWKWQKGEDLRPCACSLQPREADGKGGVSCGQGCGSGKAVGLAKQRRRGWVPLFGQGHRPVGPAWLSVFHNLSQNWLKL